MTRDSDEGRMRPRSPGRCRWLPAAGRGLGQFSSQHLQEGQGCQHCGFRLLASGNCGNAFLCVKPPRFVEMCYSSQEEANTGPEGEMEPETEASAGDRAANAHSWRQHHARIQQGLKQELYRTCQSSEPIHPLFHEAASAVVSLSTERPA